MISALFVETNGVYFNDSRVDPWDVNRNALNYKGPHKIIAHPPCQRWGRYWSGGPMLAKTNRALPKGDDNNCFAHALWAVRTFGGVIEHPEASHAWAWFGLNKPPKSGGWIEADRFGGYTCCVEQGHYGHKARKATWLYIVNCKLMELKWGPAKQNYKIDEGFRTKEQAKAIRSSPTHMPAERLSKSERAATPEKFKDILIEIVKGK